MIPLTKNIKTGTRFTVTNPREVNRKYIGMVGIAIGVIVAIDGCKAFRASEINHGGQLFYDYEVTTS
jgi:hypothetical protein